MGTYRKPHVAVNQNFAFAPGAVAVEGLPPAVCATQYNVYEKKTLGDIKGPYSTQISWGDDKVLFDKTVSGKAEYDFYPAKIYLETQYFGDIDITDKFTKDSSGITNDENTFNIPDTTITEDSGSAYMPHYRNQSVAIKYDSGSKIVTVENAALNNVGLVRGQAIYVDEGAGLTKVGEILAVSSDGSKITMLNAASSSFDGTNEIVIGATTGNPSIPNTIRSSINLRAARVKAGDIVSFNSKSLPGNDTANPFTASVKRLIDDYTVEIFTGTAQDSTNKEGLTDITEYDSFQGVAGGRRVNLDSMTVNRLIAYSTYVDVAALGTVSKTNDTTWVVTGATVSDIGLAAGDQIAIVDTIGTNVSDFTSELDTITSITDDGSDTTIVVESGFSTSDTYIKGWKTSYSGTIKASFRSVEINSEEAVFRITSANDIETYFGEISPYNEIAFMCNIIRGQNGGQVLYARRTDSREDEIVGSYSEALSDMRKHDVYSMVFGTRNSGVNSLLPSHVNEQSEPYKKHERIGLLTFDPMDALLMASGTISGTSSGVITVDFDPSAAEIGIDDMVYVDDAFIGKVIATPNSSEITVSPEAIEDGVTSGSISVIAGRDGVKAEKIGNLSYGDRRITVVWPGEFQGEIGGEILDIPGYFITAAIAGMDDGQIASQSFTNLDFGIAGISNISLKTDTVYQVEDLDAAAGAGINIMVQDGEFVSQLISSRHDLTTDMTDILRRERSITKQADVVAKTLRNIVKPYVGKYNITDKFLEFIQKSLGIGARKLTNNITKKVTIKSVQKDPDVADKIVIGVKQTVFVAGNYYEINLNVNV